MMCPFIFELCNVKHVQTCRFVNKIHSLHLYLGLFMTRQDDADTVYVFQRANRV